MGVRWTWRDVIAGVFIFAGITMLLVSAGTSDYKSLVYNDPMLASDGALMLLTMGGCVSSLVGVYILIRGSTKKGA